MASTRLNDDRLSDIRSESQVQTQLFEGIDWVGFIDWNIRDFHSFSTNHGATYNAYLIRDKETALIDTVKQPYWRHLLRNIERLCALDTVRYLVCNHAEPDHSSALPQIMAAMPQLTLVCTKKCHAILQAYYDTSSWTVKLVGNGDSLQLGKHTLQFLETPMVHWPDSMFTYVPERQLLFSMDAFGQHYASTQRFADELPAATVMSEAKTYYANIVTPYGKPVSKVLAAAAQLPLQMLAPSHGLIWRGDLSGILNAYHNWANHLPQRKVVIVYDSMWESTTALADAIAEGAAQPGVDVRVLHLRRSTLTEVATEVLDAAAVAFGSATLNQDMMPMVGAALTYLRGLRPENKAALAFGSYGWGRGGAEAITTALEQLNWQVLQAPLKCRYRPDAAVLQQCRAAGELLANAAQKWPDGSAQ